MKPVTNLKCVASALALLQLFPLASFADPTPADTSSAYNYGYRQGQNDGDREGDRRGRDEGQRAGYNDGYRNGYNRCEREERQRAYDDGFRSGYPVGESEGRYSGQSRGDADGQNAGYSEGTANGSRQADRDAYEKAAPLGRAQGISEANSSDASARGTADGTAAGDKAAREDAVAVDYPRGRKDYYNQRYAEPVKNNDQFSNRSTSFEPDNAEAASTSSAPEAPVSIQSASCSFSKPEENQACQNGYRSGYDSAYRSSYSRAYNSAHMQGEREGETRGCYDARNQNYRSYYESGYSEGRSRGYNATFQSAYNYAYRNAYDRVYQGAYTSAYNNTYQPAYNRHFEEARAEAYRQQYNALYNAAYSSAKKAKYDEMYPIYQAQEYARGQADEAADFAARPVRFLTAEAKATLQGGLFEPGDIVRIQFNLRNFADGGLKKEDIRLKVEALNPESAVISESEALLKQDLREKSVTQVNDALELRFNESAVKTGSKLKVTAFYQGKDVGSQVLTIQPKFMIITSLAEKPFFSEGMTTTLKIKVKNQSKLATDEGFAVALNTNPKILEVLNSPVPVGVINAGEEKVIEFQVIARVKGESVTIPFAAYATLKSGRRVGLLEMSDEYAVINDYVIQVKSSLADLRKAATVRAEYVITNVNSRVTLKGLQLKTRILGPNAENFTVIGPNPQYLSPILNGQSKSFVVPILSKKANSGGTVELEVQEDGRTVVIHRANF